MNGERPGTRVMRRVVAAWLAVALPASGCASYTPSPAPVGVGQEMQWFRSADGIVVGVDTYGDVPRQKAVFDADFHDKRVVAIQVVARNEADRRLVLRPSDTLLELADGRQLGAASPSTVATKVGESGSVLGAAIAFGVIGMLAASHAEEQARAARLSDYGQKALSDVTLEGGGEARGFLYFVPPKGTPPFERGTLVLSILDGSTRAVHRVPLTRLAYRGWDIDGKFLDASAVAPIVPGPSSPMAGVPAPPLPGGRAATAPAATDSPPPAATPAASAIGTWKGTLQMSPFGVVDVGTARTTLRIEQSGEQLRWTMTSVLRNEASYSGAGTADVRGDTITLRGEQEFPAFHGSRGFAAGALSTQRMPVTYTLQQSNTLLDGTAVSADNRVHTLKVLRER